MNKQFTKTTEYLNKEIAYSYLILLKTRELAHYLTGKNPAFSFIENTSKLNISRLDSDETRQKILAINYTDWQKMGFSKGTLYYMKKNVKAEKLFTLNKHVRERLDQWENGCASI